MISNEQPAKVRALAMELKAARERAGLRTRDAAVKIGTSAPTLNRSEKAKRFSPIEDVSALLAIYGVTGFERMRLMELAQDLDKPHWVESEGKSHRITPSLRLFEAQATKITQFANALIPGLLQTPAYIRALMTATPFSDEGRERLVAARLERQAIFTKIVSPNYEVFLDERVLRRQVGGADVMVQQIQWLLARMEQAHISIRVIPFKHGYYLDPGAYMLMEFREDFPIVYFESAAVSGFLHKADSIHRYRGFTSTMNLMALGSADSVKFLTSMVADYERG
ncbi:helix-turn-helix domain-containing protein [Actinokineospora sp. HUAS TT18]|uniref:helix-turn-helix domain-containing protein n=1 Tax=Actinokineospora sp. HUAS TT18 TaxID=3447451 RepID=UPI003F5254BF